MAKENTNDTTTEERPTIGNGFRHDAWLSVDLTTKVRNEEYLRSSIEVHKIDNNDDDNMEEPYYELHVFDHLSEDKSVEIQLTRAEMDTVVEMFQQILANGTAKLTKVA